LHYKTGNIAFFAENRWMLTKKFSINTGFRTEVGQTDMTGTITYYPENEIPNQISHKFPLFGISGQYNIAGTMNIYGGWSQAYRQVIFKDIIPASVFEVSDKNLKDAYGSNSELGFRGTWKSLKWDATGFYLKYDNRLGTLAQSDNSGNLIIYRTNIGDSRTKGIEIFLQNDIYKGHKSSISMFTSTSYMDATYQNATVRSDNKNVHIDGNKVESVPALMSRNGITYKCGNISTSVLYSYTSESFADALNAIKPSATGATGLVPSYQLFDLNLAVRVSKQVKVQINANNVFNEIYFTKRPQFYPGPGIWPSDGRTFSGTVSIKL
ncbi:MAG: TonB-dependent receptor, partial [Saprospiraceae bacterium]